jgi:hypothetical protein
MLNRWLRFWFQPSPPTNLCVSRAVFYSALLLLYAKEDYSAWGTVSPAFWMPLPIFSALHLRTLSPPALSVVQMLWRTALLTSALGLFTNLSMAIAAATSFYLLGLPHNFGHTFHFDALLVITCVILACSRAGDAWSIDASIRRSDAATRLSGEYTWPIRLIWVAMAFVFFAAGVAKLRYGGVAWVASNNMRVVLTRAAYHVSDGDPITTAGLWIARHDWLSQSIAAVAVATELGFALALVSVWARAFFVPAAFIMLLGIRVLMGPTFGGFLVVNAFWVPWDLIGARIRAWRLRDSSPVLTSRVVSERLTTTGVARRAVANPLTPRPSSLDSLDKGPEDQPLTLLPHAAD